MPCAWYKTADGTVVHINHGRSTGRAKSCGFCGRPYREGKLCDYPIAEGKTCDAEMCNSCARTLGAQETEVGAGMKRLGDTIDVCPRHRGKAVVKDGKLQPEQGSLFSEVR